MNRTLIFSETSPSTATTVASSQPVQGADPGLPGGVAGFGLDDFESIDVFAVLQGATGGTLDVYLQVSPDAGSTWFDAIHFAQLAAAAAQVMYRATLAARFQATGDAPIVVGSALNPALAAGVVVQGMGVDRCRLIFKAASGTTAGATQKVWVVGHRMRVRETGA